MYHQSIYLLTSPLQPIGTTCVLSMTRLTLLTTSSVKYLRHVTRWWIGFFLSSEDNCVHQRQGRHVYLCSRSYSFRFYEKHRIHGSIIALRERPEFFSDRDDEAISGRFRLTWFVEMSSVRKECVNVGGPYSIIVVRSKKNRIIRDPSRHCNCFILHNLSRSISNTRNMMKLN